MSLLKATLNELFIYKEGKLYNKFTRTTALEGEEAGHINGGEYKVVHFNGKKHRVHRLIYVMHHGHIANRLQIDHINGNRTDNRIENLRAVTAQENSFNRKDVKGYYYNKKTNKYVARIKVDGKMLGLGTYETETEAKEAYLKAKQKLHKIQGI